MQGNSPEIISNQVGCHDQLESVVRKHLACEFQKPYADFNQQAFAEAEAFVQQLQGHQGLIFDSGCGVGESTAQLAAMYPQHAVLGIDQSALRTGKHHAYRQEQENYKVIRAELGDFWRLAIDHGWKLSHHFILYPNPWPKRYHLQKRWHGSPLFPALLQLGGQLELRSNWKIYLEEFSQALRLVDIPAEINTHQPGILSTPHERKYHQSGHTLWKLSATLHRATLPGSTVD